MLCVHYRQKGVVQNAFSFSLRSETEVCKMLKGLSPRKATGLDDLPARFIRDGAKGITYPISYIINLSLKTGVVPDEMKTARVIPSYKKNSKLEPGNYRPVSILSTLSKFLERAVHIHLEIYLKENDLFYKFQSGFRTSFSTDTCLTYLTDYIMSYLDIDTLKILSIQPCERLFIICEGSYTSKKVSITLEQLTQGEL